jgi:hypothetical protein
MDGPVLQRDIMHGWRGAILDVDLPAQGKTNAMKMPEIKRNRQPLVLPTQDKLGQQCNARQACPGQPSRLSFTFRNKEKGL